MSVDEIFGEAGSVGWLVDRTAGQNGTIVGTVWLYSLNVAFTCAHLMVPFADMPEAVGVYLPGFQRYLGITDTKFHPDFDRWMVRRAYAEAGIYPPPRMSFQLNNIVGLALNPRLQPVQKEAVDKKLLAFSGAQETTAFSGASNGGELMSIIQTIVNARQVGTVTICDERQRTVARVFCEAGTIRNAQYGELRNEVALYHLIGSPPVGRFFFKVENSPPWIQELPAIQRTTAGLMVETFRRLDDQARILQAFGSEYCTFTRVHDAELNTEVLPEDVRRDAVLLWPILRHETPVGKFIHNTKLNCSAILRALEALASTGQVVSATASPLSCNGKPVPLQLEPYSDITASDEIYCIHLDPSSQMPVISTGTILGARHPDSELQMHTIDIPPQLIGAPIFRDGKVIGMHCGSSSVVDEQNQLQDVSHLLWSESFYVCLNQAPPKRVDAQRPASSVDATTDTVTSGTFDATISQQNAAPGPPDSGTNLTSAPVVAASPVLETSSAPVPVQNETAASSPAVARKQTRSGLLDSIASALPFTRRKGAFEVEFQRQEFGSDRPTKISVNSRLRAGDMVTIVFRPQESLALVVLYCAIKSTVKLLYPEIGSPGPVSSRVLAKGAQLLIPEAPAATISVSDQMRTSGKIKLPGIRIHELSREESLVFITAHKEIPLTNEQAVLDQLSANAAAALGNQFDLKPMEVAGSQLYDGIDQFAPDFPFALARLGLNCE